MADKAVRRNGRPQACEPCRQAKVACDRGLPTCLRCKRRSMSLNCVYSARGAARPSQAERWAGEDVLRDSGMLQGYPVDQQMVMGGDEWSTAISPYAGIDMNMPLDPSVLQSLRSNPSYGMEPSAYHSSADASYMMLPQNQQEEFNANVWDQQASLLMNDGGPQSNLMSGDPRMVAPYYNQLQTRGLPGAQYPAAMAVGSGVGMGAQYAAMNRAAMQAPQQQTYTRRLDRR